MVKIITSGLCCILLVGCCTTPPKPPITIITETKEVFIETLYSPAPPVIPRPSLPIHNISKKDLSKDGEVVKYYKATIKVLIGYSKELSKALEQYGIINKKYKAEEKQIKEESK